MIEELMKAADVVLDEATEKTLEPHELTIHQQRRRIEKLERQLYIARTERDEWRKRYEQTLSIAVQVTDQ
jgi:hypothetical protein